MVVNAVKPEDKEFSTKEDEGAILEVAEGQRQVRQVRLDVMREERRLAEKKAEEERILAKKKEEEQRAVEQAEKAKAKAKENNVSKPATSSKEPAPNKSGRNLGTFEATAYGPDCYGCSGITANGTDIRNGNIYSNGYRVIAADPRVIPMNSIVKITYSSGNTEMAIVADVGGKIKGKIIDIAFASEAETPAFGRQQVQIELIK